MDDDLGERQWHAKVDNLGDGNNSATLGKGDDNVLTGDGRNTVTDNFDSHT